MSASLADLVDYLDDYLRIHEFPDKALNGLQVEGPDRVSRIALATDAALATFEQARAGGAQLLLVHHGLLWGERPAPIVGGLRRRVQALLEARLGLYCAHLPLDAHPDVGNNAVLAERMDLRERRPFGDWRGKPLGVGGELPQPVRGLDLPRYCEERLESPVQALAFGPASVRSLAIVSGAAAELAEQAAREGYGAFLTGESSHTAFHHAREAGIHLLFGGHYATETWGVRALGEHLASRFPVEVFFCDAPTGL